MGVEAVTTPEIGIIMGSDSDLPTMVAAVEVCQQFGVAHEVAIVSAHRTPDRMVSYGQTAHQRGLKVIIAGAGGAAHLPGMVAALTPLPVIGVPVVQILASDRPALLDQVLEYRRQLTADVMAKQEQLADLGVPEYLRRFY